MNRALRLITCGLLLALASGCAHVTPRQRLARTFIAVGAVLVVAGGLAAAGCDKPARAEGSVCGGGPEHANVAGGSAAMAAGALLIGTGFLVRPKDTPSLYAPPPPLPPVGPEPD